MKKIFAFMLTLTMLLSLTACGGSSTPSNDGSSNDSSAATDSITIKIATIHTDDYPSSQAMFKLQELLEERSNGVIKCDVYTNCALGGEQDCLDQLQMGTLDVAYVSPVAASLDPHINIFDMPFLFDSYDDVEKLVSNQEVMDQILCGFKEHGVVPVAAMHNGLRVVSSTKPINSLADLKGMKMRVPQAPVSIAIFQALGANATPIAFNELYSALQQNVVDGQENGYPTYATNKYYEVNKYVAETFHMWGIHELFYSQAFLDKLSPELQEIALQAGREAAEYQRGLYVEMQDQCKQESIDNGVTITYPDMTEWKEATEVVYTNFYAENDWAEETVALIRSALQ